MKALLRASVIFVLFLVVPNCVEAQKRTTDRIETGKITLPKFRNGTTYREVRKKLIVLGWQPVTLPTATPCGDDDRCQGLPEVFFCSGVGQAVCIYMWKKKTTLIRVYGSGESMDQDYGGLKPCPVRPTQFEPECGGRASSTTSKTKKLGSADCGLCGTWNYVGVGNDFAPAGGGHYIKITQPRTGKFKIDESGLYPDGQIHWNNEPHDLKMLNGKLVGRFVTDNFLYSTSGNKTTYKITCELMSNGKMRYSVWSAIRGGKPLIFVATKISN